MDEKPRILPLVWLLIALVLMAVMHRWVHLARVLHSPWTWTGLVPGISGVWMTAVSAAAFKKVTTGLLPFNEATALVTGGFYRYSRNPMYLGMVLLLLGTAMLYGTAGTLLPIPFFVWVIHRNFIPGEERLMAAAFGEEYLEYKNRVRRWL